MGDLLIVLAVLPFAAVVLSAVAPPAVGRACTVASGVVSLGCAIALVPSAAHGGLKVGFLRLDALAGVFVLAAAFVYAVTSVYAVGYLREDEGEEGFTRYARRFHAGLNLFAWSMMCACLVDGLALLWIGVEITTVVSALLVAIDATEDASEAAWKYVLLASVGLGIALLGTIVMYYAGSTVFGGAYDLSITKLLQAGGRLPHTPVRLAFVLAVVGFGTKAGLVPMHTWLPDAHAEAPTPVSAMLSGSLLAVSFYAVLRYFQVARAAVGPVFPQRVLLAFGVASLLLAALYVLDQHDVKRLLAYSSVEHMGILAVAVGFGAPLASAGALLHVLAHAAAKSNAFMGAGVLARTYRTKEISRIRGAMERLPVSAPLFLVAVFALAALPPFGVFRSEFQIVAGGLGSTRGGWAAVLVALVTLAFLGLATAATRMVVVPSGRPRLRSLGAAAIPVREPSWWMITPVLVGLAALVLLGVHPPADLTALLGRGAAELGGGGR
ncbi:proton-conducting transporter membrane subunit [Streptantibioticus parmotrematis]|uniref:proton-conducting transporter transmembrane domain-containing protein n=1 Tax=Streptantibioticus parmotrematis TaxID=2873249 RepID=UPI0033F63781